MLSGVAVCTLDIPGPCTSDSDSAPEVGKGLNVKGKSAKKGARAPPGRPAGPPRAALSRTSQRLSLCRCSLASCPSSRSRTTTTGPSSSRRGPSSPVPARPCRAKRICRLPEVSARVAGDRLLQDQGSERSGAFRARLRWGPGFGAFAAGLEAGGAEAPPGGAAELRS